MNPHRFLRALVAALALSLFACSQARLRVVQWNISNYAGGRVADLQNSIFGVFNGRSMDPDIILTEEFESQSAADQFVAMLNAGAGVPNLWAAAPFLIGPDTQSACFFRTDRIKFLKETVISHGGSDPLPPRDTRRYDIQLLGYQSSTPTLSLYAAHMKAGDTADDEARRLAEATNIRADSQTLTNPFLLGGDFNVQSSNAGSYQKLIDLESNNLGRFFDPISTPGTWNNNSNFRFVHTQDPTGAGGMDDRFDFILLCNGLVSNNSFNYIGAYGMPYSTQTWNDPAHSYRSWGNDGTSFNNSLTVTGNAMVGASIAQSLKNVATSAGGHLPVFLDLTEPAEIDANTTTIDFGTVNQGATAQAPIQVSDGVDTGVWPADISPLNYFFTPSAGFTSPGGTFTDTAGNAPNTHILGADTSTVGEFNGTVVINSVQPDVPPVTVHVHVKVVGSAIPPSSFTILQGSLVSGGLSDLFFSDDQRLVVRSGSGPLVSTNPVQVVFEATATNPNPTSLGASLEASGNSFGWVQAISMYNFQTQQYEVVGTTTVSLVDSIQTVSVTTNPQRFIEPGTNKLRLKASWGLAGIVQSASITVGMDQVSWSESP